MKSLLSIDYTPLFNMYSCSLISVQSDVLFNRIIMSLYFYMFMFMSVYPIFITLQLFLLNRFPDTQNSLSEVIRNILKVSDS